MTVDAFLTPFAPLLVEVGSGSSEGTELSSFESPLDWSSILYAACCPVTVFCVLYVLDLESLDSSAGSTLVCFEGALVAARIRITSFQLSKLIFSTALSIYLLSEYFGCR